MMNQENKLVTANNDNLLTPRELRLVEARKTAESHRYEVWTKDPHQPRYYKADDQEKQTLLDRPFSRPRPTTNFVGDAMTLGAVEDVAAELAYSSYHNRGPKINQSAVIEIAGGDLEQIRRTIRAERRKEKNRRNAEEQQKIDEKEEEGADAE